MHANHLPKMHTFLAETPLISSRKHVAQLAKIRHLLERQLHIAARDAIAARHCGRVPLAESHFAPRVTLFEQSKRSVQTARLR